MQREGQELSPALMRFMDAAAGCVCLQSVRQGLYLINYLLMKFHVQRSVCEVQLASGVEAGSRILLQKMETAEFW